MAASVALSSCKLQIRCKTGTLTSGSDSVKSVTLTGIDQSAEAQLLMNVADAIGSLISTPIIEILRVDSMLVYDNG